jgi:hypothetical protein
MNDELGRIWKEAAVAPSSTVPAIVLRLLGKSHTHTHKRSG